MKYCTQCGNQLNENVRFCAQCGKSCMEGTVEEQAAAFPSYEHAGESPEEMASAPSAPAATMTQVQTPQEEAQYGTYGAYNDSQAGATYESRQGSQYDSQAGYQYNSQQGNGYNNQWTQPPRQTYPSKAKSNGLAIGGFVISLCLIFFWGIPFFGTFMAVVALALSIGGLIIGGRRGGAMGMAVAGLVLSIIFLIVSLAFMARFWGPALTGYYTYGGEFYDYFDNFLDYFF